MEEGSFQSLSASAAEYPGTFIRTGTARSKRNLSREDTLSSVGSRQTPDPERHSYVSVTSATTRKGRALVLVKSAKSRHSARPLLASPKALPTIINRNQPGDPLSESQFFATIPQIQKPKLCKEDEEERKRYVAVYHLVCRRLGVIPVTSLNDKLVTSDVSLARRGLGPQGTRAVAVALVNNTRVERLDVSGNYVGTAGCSCLAQLLSVNRRINSLNLSENDIGHKGLCYITRSLRNKQEFVHLDLSHTGIGNGECSHLADLILTSKSLQELNLSHNQIEDSGAKILGKALGEAESLRKLNLSWNHIRSQGASAIGQGLEENGSLCELNVAWNGFAKKGCSSLGEALSKNEQLRDLDLRCNRINDAGLTDVIKGLKNNEVLSSLKLSMNSISADMALVLLKTIEDNEESPLQFLDIEDVVVNEGFVHLLRRMCKERDLQVIHGTVLRSSSSPVDGCTLAKVGGREINLLSFIFRLMERQKLRVVDVFRRLDTDNSDSITKQEFREAVKKHKLGVTDGQLETIIQMMDSDENGEISLEELLKAEREYTKNEREKKRKREKQNTTIETILSPAP